MKYFALGLCHILAFILLVPVFGTVVTTYIDPSCTHDGDGTVGTPCAASASAVGPRNVWPAAPNVAGADAQFLQKKGTTYLAQVTVNSGTVGHPVILGAYGTGAKPIIRSEENVTVGTIKIATDAHDITIDGLEIHGPLNVTAGTQVNAIRNNATSNASVVNITIQNSTIGPVVTAGAVAADDGVDLRGCGLIVQDSTFADIPNDGLWLDTATGVCTGPIVRRNISHRVSQTGTNGDNYQLAGTGTGGLVEDNYGDHTDVDSKNCIISNDNVIIRYNECHGPVVSSVHIDIYCDLGSICQIYRNKTYGGKIGIANYITTGTSETYSNLVLNPTTNGIETISVGAIVAGNTIDGVSAGQSAVRMTSAATGGQAFNNIFSDAGRGVTLTSGSGQTEHHNMFHGTVTTRVFDTTTNGSISATNSVVATNQFVNEGTDYRLKAGSTGLAAGHAWASCIDIRGYACNIPPAIGAYQQSSGDIVTPSPSSTRPAAPARTPAGARSIR